MLPEIAAGYVGERTVEAFLSRVGTEYPDPIVDEGTGKGRRRLWLKSHLDNRLGLNLGNDVDPPPRV
ncbi:hypothetical protein EB232_19380 [Mesorhizobium sp. NZP2077]|nr:hypothetical protein EB232_19380 [Mesorhizobium sp. NZP2077]